MSSVTTKRRLMTLNRHIARNLCSSERRVANENEVYKMYTAERDYIYLEPKTEHKYTLIWLHGLGDNAHGFLDVFWTPNFQMAPPCAKVVLLTAPTREVTLNMGMRMTSWYDIISLETTGVSKSIDLDQLKDSTDIITNVIKQEAQIFDDDYSKIFVGGFSQGACMAYNTFMTLDKTIGGVLALSGHFPPIEEVKVSESKQKVPIFSYHGEEDPMVPETLHRGGAKLLKDAGCNITYTVEPTLQHSLSMEEIKHIKAYFNEHMV